MQLNDYIRPELLVLVPVLYLVGMGAKKSSRIDDRNIPALLGLVGIVLAAVYMAAAIGPVNTASVLQSTFAAVTQGVLCAGAAVFFNQMAKQSKKPK